MLSPDQKTRLGRMKAAIVADSKMIDFRNELGAFLPADPQAIIRDFTRTLEAEISRQIV